MVQSKEVFREGLTQALVAERENITQATVAPRERMTFQEIIEARSEMLAKKVPAFIDAVTPFIEKYQPNETSAVGDAYDTLYNVSVNGAHPSGPGCHLITLSVKVLQEWHAQATGAPGQEYEPFTLIPKGTLALPTE